MGTNYYLHLGCCPTCGRSAEQLHIGKSSSGWCFSLHVDRDLGLNSLDDWRAKFQLGTIKTEYGEVKTIDEMIDVITNRRHPIAWKDKKFRLRSGSESEFMAQNCAQRGPNNLLRHRIDGRHCIGHGDGTYDLIPGEFS